MPYDPKLGYDPDNLTGLGAHAGDPSFACNDTVNPPADGNYSVFHIAAIPKGDANGKLIGFFCTCGAQVG